MSKYRQVNIQIFRTVILAQHYICLIYWNELIIKTVEQKDNQ